MKRIAVKPHPSLKIPNVSNLPSPIYLSVVPETRKSQVPDSPGSVIAPNFYSSDAHRIPR